MFVNQDCWSPLCECFIPVNVVDDFTLDFFPPLYSVYYSGELSRAWAAASTVDECLQLVPALCRFELRVDLVSSVVGEVDLNRHIQYFVADVPSNFIQLSHLNKENLRGSQDGPVTYGHHLFFALFASAGVLSIFSEIFLELSFNTGCV